MDTAIEHPQHPVSDRVKPSHGHPGTLMLRAEYPPDVRERPDVKNSNDCLTRTGTGCSIGVPIWQQWASKGGCRN